MFYAGAFENIARNLGNISTEHKEANNLLNWVRTFLLWRERLCFGWWEANMDGTKELLSLNGLEQYVLWHLTSIYKGYMHFQNQFEDIYHS